MFGKNYGWNLCAAKNMYKMFGGSVVAVAFQSIFYLEMHQNNIFFYLKKIIFEISVSKWSENIKIYQFEAKKKIKKI